METIEAHHKKSIARLIESDLQNAPLAYNLAVSAGLKEWFLAWFRNHEKVKPIADFVLAKWAYVDHSIIDYERFTRPTDQYLVDVVLDAQSDYLWIVKTLSDNMVVEDFMYFVSRVYASTLKNDINASTGGIMTDTIDFISDNAPTGEFIVPKSHLTIQKRLVRVNQ